jgi:4-azaleucine resistance transporter AzlC
MNKPTGRSAFWAGARATIPLVVGASPFGLIFGALAVSEGLSPNGTLAMSAIVFAGSAQFISISLISSGANLAVIVGTTFVVNLRHMLYSATLAPHFKNLPQRWMLPLSFWLTDESFVASIKYFDSQEDQNLKKYFLLGSELFMYLNWLWVTWLGVRLGQSIPDPGKWGLDFAMVVTFIGMLIPEIKDRPSLAAAVVAAGAALLGRHIPNQLGLLLAAFLGILVAILIENRAAKAQQL